MSAVAQGYIIYHELEHLKICLDTATDMNEYKLNTVPGDNSDTDTDLGSEKSFYDKLSDCDNEKLYIPIVPTLSE